MKLSDKLQQELNNQINEEMYSSYLYLAMAAWFEDENWQGMANWMHAQAMEEWGHAMKIYRYIYERRGRVELQAIQAPPKDFDSPVGIFQAAFEHEQHISQRIADLSGLARKEDDYATESFLQWFVDEQVEEEASVDEVIQKLQMVGESRPLLYMLDKELGQRPKSASEG